MNKVVLLNRSLTISAPPVLVQGWGGEQIGVSRYSPPHNCHILELPFDVYNRFSETLMKAAHQMTRKWEPKFVEEAIPNAVQEFQAGYNIGMEGKLLPDLASESAKAGHIAALSENGEETGIMGMKGPVFPHYVPPPGFRINAVEVPETIDESTHHKTLERIARDEGISLEGIRGTPAKLQAIRIARESKWIEKVVSA